MAVAVELINGVYLVTDGLGHVVNPLPGSGGNMIQQNALILAALRAGGVIRSGTTVPSNSLGYNNDFYVNTLTHVLYGPKASGVWPAGTALIGPNTVSTATTTSITGLLKGDGTNVAGASAGSDYVAPADARLGRAFNATFILAVGANAVTGVNVTNAVIAPYAGVFNGCRAYAKTGPAGANLIFDIKKNGTTIWTNTAHRICIVAGQTAGSQTAFEVAGFAAGDLLTIDIVQTGGSTPGKDITVSLACTLTA